MICISPLFSKRVQVDFFFLLKRERSQETDHLKDDDCSHKIKRHLFLGRKAVTNLDNVLQSRDIILPTKVYLVKAMVFPYGLP